MNTSDESLVRLGCRSTPCPLPLTGAGIRGDFYPTSHERALDELERIATVGQSVEWYAYGLPVLQGEKYELFVGSVDHLYLIDPHQR